MAGVNSRRSSTEEDYRELYEAAIHDQVRDGIEDFAARRKANRRTRTAKVKDNELTRIATNISTQIGVAPQTLAAIDARLDPTNEAFDFRFWFSTFLPLIKEDGIQRATFGFSFKSLNVSGSGAAIAVQPTVATLFKALLFMPILLMNKRRPKKEKMILNNLNGSVKMGEMLLVLGRPGSGCTTFLKSISGQLQGLTKSADSVISYDGIPQDVLIKNFKGRAVYNEENDEHFPQLTVEQTLQFAAAAQTPQARIQDVDRETHTKHMLEVMLRIFGLSHTRNTNVGNDTIRGVSGGERKRVSIAEMALARASVAAWDNSTRGLDSATALDFINSLQTLADMAGVTQAVALYQASQAIYECFDKVLVLYEGRQIFFGPIETAREYFQTMGWHSSPRQTTPDFLTSVTNPSEREPLPGFEGNIPRSAIEFEQYWLRSEECKTVMTELQQSNNQQDDRLQTLRDVHRSLQSDHTRAKSPYMISIWMQMRLCMKRSYQLLWNSKSSLVFLAAGRIILALIVGSIYYGPSDNTDSLKSRGAVIFLATLTNALMAVTEIGSLFGKREIVEKQKNYAFYHPFADAVAAYVVDIPVKFVISTLFNIVFYFLTGLRMSASAFFIFLLFNFVSILVMSAIFRTIGSVSKVQPQAYAIAGIGILIMIIYTGYTLQTTYMHPWFRWINYINPIGYVFEALLMNEVHGRNFPCAPDSIVPPYAQGSSNFACAVIGAQPNDRSVSGDAWALSGYDYTYSHVWRNFGITIAYLVVFLALHLLAVEFRSTATARPQRLIFRNRKVANSQTSSDVESNGSEKSKNFISASVNVGEKLEHSTTIAESRKADSVHKVNTLTAQTNTLMWQDLTLDINIQGNPRRLLDNVSGWVKPGTMTCLMGVSGAGKTTLLDTLAQRQNTVGKRSGSILVDGMSLKPSFQRNMGYVQQQDLHLGTSTVREALRFSAMLRQPASVSKEEKFAYVEKVIEMLNMEYFSEAIIGQPGEGLNIEQRKLLTIGVELAAKPSILFLDEPTSGLDSQSSWTIISLLRKLSDNGQGILATIHQPSAMLFQQFDSILLLAKGGRTTYFGPLGTDCRTLTGYFVANGAQPCKEKDNPAEYILGVIDDQNQSWPDRWIASQESDTVKKTLENLTTSQSKQQSAIGDDREFALSFPQQFNYVVVRLFKDYWRTPGYIVSKFASGILSALFIGFSFFLQNSSATGMQNTVFAIFMLNATFSTTVNQINARFIPYRSLFEVRESPSKMYSWLVFLLAHILVEIPYQIFLSVLVWASWYFPVFGMSQSPTNQALMFVFCMQFFVFASTFAQMIIFTVPSTEIAGTLSTLLFTLTLQFNGVLQPPTALPGFWIFMYRLSPFTWLVGAWTGTGLENRPVVCAYNELAIFDPPSGLNCGAYLQRYIQGGAPGSLLNPTATANCEYCPIRNADQFLATSWIYPSDKYRNMGIMFAYIAFNAIAAVSFYYLFRYKRISMKFIRKEKKKVPKVERETHADEDAEQWKPRYSKLGFYLQLGMAILRNIVR